MSSTGLHYNERGILAVNTIPWYHFALYRIFLIPKKCAIFNSLAMKTAFLDPIFLHLFIFYDRRIRIWYGFVAGSVPRTYGSGSWRPKNIWIRIPNTQKS
jgi:hypothetical protein